jgi:DNA gyrase subunit A
MANEPKGSLHLEDEMRSSFLDYAMSVIISRALPDVRDGLKPVHRRILYAMQQLKNTHNQPYKKSARIVGDVIGKYHPHGESAVYDALVRLAQNFAMRYPLVDGQGNFGSVDGDPAAAMRYTESRMQKLASELLTDLDKNTVEFVPNYDDKEYEPAVLPTKVPNLLLNGAVGIAVGMATNIPPHNLTEVVNATLALIDEPELDPLELLDIVTGPDFPTGGLIIGRMGIQQAYVTGRGNVTIRAKCEIEEDAKGRESIIVTEIPYQVNKVKLIERMAELVRDKRLEGISDIQDYSDRTGMRIWIQVKRDASAQIVLNTLYKMTDLQTSFGVNMIAIVDGRPVPLTLHAALQHFIDHRRTVVTRRSRYDLEKAQSRREVVEGIGVAIDAIDNIIAIIRGSRDPETAKAALMSEKLSGFAGFLERCGRSAEEVEKAKAAPYQLNERQAKAILEMRLQRLTGLEREKIEGEFKELSAEIARLEAILSDPSRLMKVIRDELVEILEQYGDGRRTQIVEVEHEITPIDLVADDSMVVMRSHLGYIKRIPTTEYRVQQRGGVGVKAKAGHDDDFVAEMFEASAHQFVLLFTNTGRVFRKRVFELPQGRRESRGKALINFLDLREGEKVLHMLPYRDEEVDADHFVVLASQLGYIKRTSLTEFANIRASGLIAATVAEDDAIIGAEFTDGTRHVLMASEQGMAIRFAEDEVRPMGRTARGVKGMGLRNDDRVVSLRVLEPGTTNALLTLCEKGYGKRTPATDYRSQSRSGLGLITIKVTDRNGPVVGMLEVANDDQIMVVTNGAKVIRTPVSGISELGRNTQGVRIIRLQEGESVAAFERIVADEDVEETDETPADASAEEVAAAKAEAADDAGDPPDDEGGDPPADEGE